MSKTNLLFFFTLLLMTILFVGTAFPQTNEIGKFILPGYQVMDTLRGDLNMDGRMDMLLILKVKGEDTLTADSVTIRPLFILIRQTDGNLKLAARNDEVVMCYKCGGVFGDPYSKMVITGAYFSVEHYGGSSDRWSDITTFKYDKIKQQWFLHRWGGEGYNTNEPTKITSWGKTTKDFGVVEFSKLKRDILN